MYCLEGSPIHSPRRVVSYFYRHVGSIFSKTTSFILESDIFSHGNGHLDIQVGSRICLNVCLHRIIAYALTWGVTHLG